MERTSGKLLQNNGMLRSAPHDVWGGSPCKFFRYNGKISHTIEQNYRYNSCADRELIEKNNESG